MNLSELKEKLKDKKFKIRDFDDLTIRELYILEKNMQEKFENLDIDSENYNLIKYSCALSQLIEGLELEDALKLSQKEVVKLEKKTEKKKESYFKNKKIDIKSEEDITISETGEIESNLRMFFRGINKNCGEYRAIYTACMLPYVLKIDGKNIEIDEALNLTRGEVLELYLKSILKNKKKQSTTIKG